MDNPVLLLVDIGNSFAKFGESDRTGNMIVGLRVSTRDPQSRMEIKSYLHNLRLDQKPERVVVSSVGDDSLLRYLSDVVTEILGVPCHQVMSSATGYGLTNCYKLPSTLGADRWCALVGANRIYNGACCVLDAGSAVTIDMMASDGRFRGGIILPGWQAWLDALHHNADLLITTTDFKAEAGCSTGAAVSSGFVNAVIGAFERLFQQFTVNEKDKPMIFLTGGDAEIIAKFVNFPYRHEPELVLHGLATIGKALQ